MYMYVLLHFVLYPIVVMVKNERLLTASKGQEYILHTQLFMRPTLGSLWLHAG